MSRPQTPRLGRRGRWRRVTTSTPPCRIRGGPATSYLIDRVFIVATTLVVTVPFSFLSGVHDTKDVIGFMLVALLIVCALYLCLFPATWLEGTPGKAICGLKIVTYGGDRIGLGRSIWRGLSQLCIEIRVRSLMRNVMAALSSTDEMTFYDCMCDTRVVRSR
jgi:uncharacterized RDD family membrane protein YckC